MSHRDHKHRRVPDEIESERLKTILLIIAIAAAFLLAGYIDMHSGVH